MVTTAVPQTPPAERNGATLPQEYNPEYDPEYLLRAYPPNEEPMAEAARFLTYWLDMMWPLYELFGKLPNVFINGNVFIYYRVGGVLKWVAPDLMISFDVSEDFIKRAGSYHMWAIGKPLEFVMEIGSDSTADRDLTEKLLIYAQIAAREYWLFDPPDGLRYGFILKGLRLVDGKYEEIPMLKGFGDDIRGHSAVLGLDICWENGAIHFYDPKAGAYHKNQFETIADRDAAVAAIAERDAEIERLRALLADQEQS